MLKIEKLKEIFKSYPYIVAAYIFGSQLSGKITPMSDVDIAILLKEEIAPKSKELIHEEDYLAYKIAKALEVKEVDLISLNKQGLIFQHNVLKSGKLIYDAQPELRIKFEMRTISNFCDFEPTLRFMEKFNLQGRIMRCKTL